MITCRPNCLPRIYYSKKISEEQPVDYEEEVSEVHIDVIEPDEPVDEFAVALQDVSSKIRDSVTRFLTQAVEDWKLNKLNVVDLLYESNDEFDLSFKYLLKYETMISTTNPDELVNEPKIQFVVESIFGRRAFILNFSRAIDSDETLFTALKEDIVGMIASEMVDDYMLGRLGGIAPDFQADCTYE